MKDVNQTDELTKNVIRWGGDSYYSIVAYGPGKECKTWSGADNLEDTKRYLMQQGYDSFKIEEERK